MPMIEALFARHGITPAQCDAFAYASGPGSFTGLRVACTLVQGLALGAGRPVIAVGNLLALAAGAAAGGDAAVPVRRRVLAAVDARMQQAYVAIVEGAGTDWQILLPPAVIATTGLAALAADWRPDICAGDAGWLGANLSANVAGVPSCIRDARVDAGVLARLALDRLARGAVLGPEAAVPDYVRNDVARTVVQRAAALRAGAA